eukprot:SAG31_NODE_44773_length_261_cov_0.925926_1_plen_82_part_10
MGQQVAAGSALRARSVWRQSASATVSTASWQTAPQPPSSQHQACLLELRRDDSVRPVGTSARLVTSASSARLAVVWLSTESH